MYSAFAGLVEIGYQGRGSKIEWLNDIE